MEQAIFLSEEKHSEVMKQREEEWRAKERSLTREISHLSGEKQQINNQLAVLRESDVEKAAIIKRLNFDHEQAVKGMIDLSKQDQSKEYSRYKVIERSAQEREFEVRRLEGKVEVLRIDKELLEKQLLNLRKYYSPNNSPTVTRVMKFSDREREQSRKIRDLEDKLRGLPRERGSITPTPRLSTPTRKITVPTPRFSTPTPTPDSHSPASPESEEQLTNFKKKNKELRERVRKLEERCSSLELRNASLESERSLEEDYIQREIKLKEKYSCEMEQLESEGEALREKLRDLSSDENSSQKLEEMTLEVERCQNRYKKLYLELLMSQQLALLWSERVDTEAMELVQVELEEKIQELDEIHELNESLNIRVECLKDEFFSVQIQNDRLIEENGISVSVKEELERELEAVNESLDEYKHIISEKDKEIGELFQANERLKSQQEGFSLLMDKHIQEIDAMKAKELELNSQRQQFESVKEKLQQVEGKERELMAIIQTLEDRNSQLQNELQLKEDELASKAKRKPVRDDKSYGRAEVLFYPQSAKFYRNNNNNNNSSEDEENNDSAGNASDGDIIPLAESNDGVDRPLIEVDTETTQLSIDQLSNASSNSQTEELSPLNVLTELGTPVLSPHTPKPALIETDSGEDGGNSIGEWSHTSEENIGTTPQSPNLSPIPTPLQTPMKQNPEVYLIRYSYDPLLSSPNPHPEQELPLTAGEYVYVYGGEDEDGFYVGKLPGGKHGLVPSNFVEKIQHTFSSSETKPKEDLSPIESLESAKGPLELYLRSQSGGDPPLHNSNSNLSNIIEEDESLLEVSNLTKISGNISSTESIKLQTSNESLDKISELHSSNPPSPRHILTPSDIKVSYTPGDIEVNWEHPSYQDVTGMNVTFGDDTLTYIDSGNKNSFLFSSLDRELSQDIHTLTLSAVTETGTSEGVEFTVDRREVLAPYGLSLCEDENGLKVSWQLPDTESLSSPLISFQIHLNGELIRTVDYSEFIIDNSVFVSERDLLKLLESSPDGKVSISVRSVLSDGRQSQLSVALEVPSRLSTSSEATPIRMISLDSDSTGDGSRRSSSSESEVLEVFRKSSLESDQILNQFRIASQQEVAEMAEVVSKPPIDPRTVLASLGGRQRQSFTPNEDDLFTELEAQGAANITPSPIFSIDEPQTQSDSEDEPDSPHYTEIPTLDVTVTYYVALYDYNPKEEPTDYQPELELQKGEVVAIYGQVDEDGFLQAQVDDKMGLVPYNLVEKIDLSDISGETSSALLFQATKQAFPAKKYTALYSYNPRVDSPNSEDMDDELSFKSGASISIYGDVQEDGFYIGEQNGEMGFVPSNFVEPSDHIKPPQSPQPLDTSGGSKGASPLEPHKTKTILAKTKGIFKSLSKKS